MPVSGTASEDLMLRLVRLALAHAAVGCRRGSMVVRRRNGSVQGVNSLLMIIGVLILLYFLARTQVSEPLTWLYHRLQEVVQ
jgi:hypothetical protein